MNSLDWQLSSQNLQTIKLNTKAMAIKVTLRQKPISGERLSLYLDFYPPVENPKTGKATRREFLNIFIPKPIKHNKRTDKAGNTKQIPVYDANSLRNAMIESEVNNLLLKAEQIRNDRFKYFNRNEELTALEKKLLDKEMKEAQLGEKDFVEYFRTISNKRKSANYDNWVSAFRYFEKFTSGKLKFAELNERFCNDFKEFLLSGSANKLSQNSASSYFNKFKATLKQAYKEGYLKQNLNAMIDYIEVVDVIKNTLTIEELNAIAQTDFENDLCKRATLFSALTGLPYMEMKNLKWEQIDVSEIFGCRIKMIRQKTKKGYYTNIGEDAFKLMGEPKEPSELVFAGLNNQIRYVDFRLLLLSAGIKKKMTFHDLRHSYGTMQIDFGTDVYTLQGNMGHSTVRQTMNYAKISESRKREAAERIKLNYGK
jgi:site-specific recombinase XerD